MKTLTLVASTIYVIGQERVLSFAPGAAPVRFQSHRCRHTPLIYSCFSQQTCVEPSPLTCSRISSGMIQVALPLEQPTLLGEQIDLEHLGAVVCPCYRRLLLTILSSQSSLASRPRTLKR